MDIPPDDRELHAALVDDDDDDDDDSSTGADDTSADVSGARRVVESLALNSASLSSSSSGDEVVNDEEYDDLLAAGAWDDGDDEGGEPAEREMRFDLSAQGHARQAAAMREQRREIDERMKQLQRERDLLQQDIQAAGMHALVDRLDASTMAAVGARKRIPEGTLPSYRKRRTEPVVVDVDTSEEEDEYASSESDESDSSDSSDSSDESGESDESGDDAPTDSSDESDESDESDDDDAPTPPAPDSGDDDLFGDREESAEALARANDAGFAELFGETVSEAAAAEALAADVRPPHSRPIPRRPGALVRGRAPAPRVRGTAANAPGSANPYVILTVQAVKLDAWKPQIKIEVTVKKPKPERRGVFLVGDLVDMVGSPLLTFRLACIPVRNSRAAASASAAAAAAVAAGGIGDDDDVDTYEIVSILAVVAGPCKEATTAAKLAQRRGSLADAPTILPRITYMRLRTTLCRSDYFGIFPTTQTMGRKLEGIVAPMRADRSKSLVSMSFTTIELEAALGGLQPGYDTNRLVLALFYSLRDEEFYTGASPVGARGYIALSAPRQEGARSIRSALQMAAGNKSGFLDDPAEDTRYALEILELVLIANLLTDRRLGTLLGNLRLNANPDAEARAARDVIIRCAKIRWKLGPEPRAISYFEAEPIDVNTFLHEKLEARGLYLGGTPTGRKYVCWETAREYFEMLNSAFGDETTVVRVECDDDPADTADTGYIGSFLPGLQEQHGDNAVIVTVDEERVRQLRQHLVGMTILHYRDMQRLVITADTVIVIDRMHQIDERAIQPITQKASLTPGCRVYICGSINVAPRPNDTTLFAQIYFRREASKRAVVNSAYPEYKFANPLANPCDVAMVYPPHIFVINAKIHEKVLAMNTKHIIPDALSEKFKFAPVVSPGSYVEKYAWRTFPTAICVLTREWMYEHVALVAALTEAGHGCIWFVNGELLPSVMKRRMTGHAY